MSSNFREKKWSVITREERFFTCELYHSLKENPAKSIKEISNYYKRKEDKKEIYKLLETFNSSKNDELEIGFEVCFYRDIIKEFGDKIDKNFKREYKEKGWLKHTFDLCIFSKNKLIIIEAKVQQGFTNKQIKRLMENGNKINELFNELGLLSIETSVLLLHSSSCKHKKIEQYKDHKCCITWKEMSEIFGDKEDLFKNADKLYKK